MIYIPLVAFLPHFVLPVNCPLSMGNAFAFCRVCSVLQKSGLVPICSEEFGEHLQCAGKCDAEISATTFQEGNNTGELSSLTRQQ